MRRPILTAIVLAALSVSSANASSVSPAKTHKHAAAASPAAQNKANRPTPEEVGRAAGMKIRQDLARRRAAQAAAHRLRPVRPSQSRQERHEPFPAEVPQRSREHAARTTEIASLKVESSLSQPSMAPTQAEPSSEPSPFSESRSSPENEPTAETNPTFKAETRANAHPRAQESETVSADSDSSESDVKPFTRRAALRPASLHTSRFGMPPPLVGSRAILEHQNTMSDAEGLERIEDEDDLADRIAQKLLVPVPTSIALTINGNLPVNHRYCRPWTAVFLSDLARSHAAEFNRPLEVSSAVRTVAYQKRLMGINGNAAAAEGDIVSPHLTGATIDIAKGPLSRQEIAWMRLRLLPLEQAGKIDVEEEFQQACFHITVYKSYMPPTPHRPGKSKATPSNTTQAAPATHHHGRRRTEAEATAPPPVFASLDR